jgi:hypothetical protein
MNPLIPNLAAFMGMQLTDEIKRQGDRMKRLGDHLWSIRNQLNSETEFQAWLNANTPEVNPRMIKDAMLFSLECQSNQK